MDGGWGVQGQEFTASGDTAGGRFFKRNTFSGVVADDMPTNGGDDGENGRALQDGNICRVVGTREFGTTEHLVHL